MQNDGHTDSFVLASEWKERIDQATHLTLARIRHELFVNIFYNLVELVESLPFDVEPKNSVRRQFTRVTFKEIVDSKIVFWETIRNLPGAEVSAMYRDTMRSLYRIICEWSEDSSPHPVQNLLERFCGPDGMGNLRMCVAHLEDRDFIGCCHYPKCRNLEKVSFFSA
jgi:ssDNA-binding Zn-finger/Zn-ribbon topoisomerase 1